MDRREDQPAPMYRPDDTAQNFAYQIYTWLQPILFALAVLVVVSTFLGRLIGVEGDSMLPTLQNKNMVILQSVGYTPKNGDIVVVSTHSYQNGTPIIKRIIATGGQSVSIDYDAPMPDGTYKTVVYVDGVAQDDSFLGEPMHIIPDQFLERYPITVPEGRLFIMGDNRNHSSDSRRDIIGLVDERCVLGRAVWVLIPFGRVGR